jgi:hypothetical protein
MNITFKTLVDKYKTNCWPTNIDMPPRIGETVMVTDVFFDFYSIQKLPTKMKVVDVIYTDKGVICELFYSDFDLAKSKISGVIFF